MKQRTEIESLDYAMTWFMCLVCVALLGVIAFFALQEKPIQYSDIVRTFEIVKADKTGKSGKVVLRDVATGWTSDRLSIGSCNRDDVARIKIGSKWDVHEVTYVYPKKQEYYTSFEGLYKICPKNW